MCFPIRAFALSGRPFGGGVESQGVATLCPGLTAFCPFRVSWQSVRCVPSFVACSVLLCVWFCCMSSFVVCLVLLRAPICCTFGSVACLVLLRASFGCVPSFVVRLVWLCAFFFLFSRRFCARWVLGYCVRHIASLHFVLSFFGVGALKGQQATSPGQSVATPWDLRPHMALSP